MQARIVSAASGARWMADGWRIFRAAPLGWLLLVLAYLLAMQLLALVPILGSAVVAVAVPGLTLGFMAVARSASRGGPAQIGLLLEGFRNDARRQLGLGAAYLLCTLVVLALTVLADEEGTLRAMMSGEHRPDLSPGDLAAPLAVFGLAYTPVMMMFWFAPPLCGWHSIGVAKALFFSFFGCLLNWRAFVAYGAVAGAAIFGLNLLLAALLLLGVGAPTQAQVLSLIASLLLIALPTLFASFYASYRDVFGYDPAP